MNINYNAQELTYITLNSDNNTKFFTKTFFSHEQQSISSEIVIDVKAIGNKVAPIVFADDDAVKLHKSGYESLVITPAYISIYNEITPGDIEKRPAGIDPYNYSAAEAMDRMLSDSIRELKNSIENRKEEMAAQAIIDGKIKYKLKTDGSNSPEYTIDFQRSSEHKPTITNSWNNAKGDILKNIQEWRSLIMKNGHNAQADTLILGLEAKDVFFKNADVERLVHKYDERQGSTVLQEDGLFYYGFIPGIGNVYSYEKYIEEDGKVKNILDPKNVVYGASKSGNVMAYGAIRNFVASDSGLLPSKYFTYIKPEDKRKQIHMESSFLPVLANPNAFVSAKVIS